MRYSFLTLAVALASGAGWVQAAEPLKLGSSEIIGSKAKAAELPGSGTVLTQEDLDKFKYTDINRVLAEVPGIYLRSEEGYGLRPNIGIRGAAGERSQRITLMEDGILIAPAPYAAPSAYYFPTMGRIAGVEVLKGPAAIANGPYTIGGALNLLSTPIPVESIAGRFTQELGSENLYRTHAHVGGSAQNFGWLVEGHTHATDGFAETDRASDKTGFDKDDLMVKLRLNSDPGAEVYHQLDLKLQYAQEDSDQTYVGLTDRDFKRDSERRYGLTTLDNMRNNFKGTTLGYLLDTGDFRVSTQAYYHEFQRNWYKVDKIGGLKLGNFFDCANAGNGCGGVGTQANAQAILDGSAAGRVDVKGNFRKYQSKGIQTRVNKDLQLGSIEHGLELGARYHEDQEFRDQFSDRFDQDAAGNLNATGIRTREAKRTQRAKAVSYYVTDAIKLGDLTLTPGMRVEDYKIGRRNDDKKDQHDRETLFGLGALYKLNQQWSLLAGVHEGFSPTSSVGADVEQALNYELGARYNDGRLSAEVVGFYSDYDNLLGTCTASTGASCDPGDQFNGGEVEVYGIESRFAYDLVRGNGFTIPVALTYTWTDSEFQTSFDNGFFGTVEKGDALPSLPEHQAVLSVGYRNEQGFATDLRTSWYDSTCSKASCNAFEKIDSYYTVDLATRYALDKQTEVYLNLLNLTDNSGDIIARQPAGARGQMPRSAIVGVSYSF
jgi:Fe(3+) dicitrate transport protein